MRLEIPSPDDERRIVTSLGMIDDIEQSAAELRRVACARAAAIRAGAASSDDGSDDDLLLDDATDDAQVVWVSTLPVAGSIGGKIWDASLLMSAWIRQAAREEALERRLPPPTRMLELGAGLGIVGLAAAQTFPSARVTLSDYDPEVVANLRQNVLLNYPEVPAAAEGAAPACSRIDVAAIDFREFTREHGVGDADCLTKYAGLYGAFDMILGSDVVYELGHCHLANVCLSLLARRAPTDEGNPPCAIFLLPDSRPRLRDFVTALADAGLSCRIERVQPTSEMMRHLRHTHEGWGAGGASFSLYFVRRMAP